MKFLHFKNRFHKYTSVLFLIFTVFNCSDYKKTTQIKVIDPTRHYYPILQKSKLQIVYELLNTGNSTLYIDEVQWSCGCIVGNYTKNIPSGKKGFIELTYDSSKNIGLVNHFIYVYANFKKNVPLEISFDVHVVPGAEYTKDYEELFFEKSSKIEEAVDGKLNKKGYYVNFEEKKPFH